MHQPCCCIIAAQHAAGNENRVNHHAGTQCDRIATLPEGSYSSRNTFTGSTQAARNAGASDASAATARINPTTPA
jgi:hypothetical protein